jgi:hypothetical protein
LQRGAQRCDDLRIHDDRANPSPGRHRPRSMMCTPRREPCLAEPSTMPTEHPVHQQPRVTIEMRGSNIVIRSTAGVDRAYTSTLAHAVNAAAATDTTVMIDPEPIRCDDMFAAYNLPGPEVPCIDHVPCRPLDAVVVRPGIIQIRADRTTWTIDVSRGRFCQSEAPVDVRSTRRHGRRSSPSA